MRYIAYETALTLFEMLKGKRTVKFLPAIKGEGKSDRFGTWDYTINIDSGGGFSCYILIETHWDTNVVAVHAACFAEIGLCMMTFEIAMEEFRFNPPSDRWAMPMSPDCFRDRYARKAMKLLAEILILPEYAVPEECIYGM